jgi:hypothetical protein
MSSDIAVVSDRTAACAADNEQGAVAVQLVPVPEGAAYRVVGSAEADGAGDTRAITTAATTAGADLRTVGDEDANTRQLPVHHRKHATRNQMDTTHRERG